MTAASSERKRQRRRCRTREPLALWRISSPIHGPRLLRQQPVFGPLPSDSGTNGDSCPNPHISAHTRVYLRSRQRRATYRISKPRPGWRGTWNPWIASRESGGSNFDVACRGGVGYMHPVCNTGVSPVRPWATTVTQTDHSAETLAAVGIGFTELQRCDGSDGTRTRDLRRDRPAL